MKHAAIKRVLGLGVVTGLGYAAYRAYRARVPASPDGGGSWEAAPFPFPPIPRPAPAPAATPTPTPTPTRPTAVADFLERSVDPLDGECPDSHPVKGKLSSGIYHQPGGLNYARTRADRCYLDTAAAESDGLRPSKR